MRVSDIDVEVVYGRLIWVVVAALQWCLIFRWLSG